MGAILSAMKTLAALKPVSEEIAFVRDNQCRSVAPIDSGNDKVGVMTDPAGSVA